MAATNVEELTSGASGRIIPLFHRAKSMALLLFPSYNFLKKFIISFLLFLPLFPPPSAAAFSTVFSGGGVGVGATAGGEVPAEEIVGRGGRYAASSCAC
uniref:Uncharacterized protein n=1 Tax=Chenopodium quinoa TaxID=63459 RepID=A0A803NCF4_CHEQI